MKQVDRQALELAMEQTRREPDIAAQLDDKLQETKLEDGKGWACKPECWQRRLSPSLSRPRSAKLKSGGSDAAVSPWPRV